MGIDFYFEEERALKEIEKERQEYIAYCLSLEPFPPNEIQIIEANSPREFLAIIEKFKKNNPEFYQIGKTKMIERHPFRESDPIRMFIAVMIRS